MTLKDDIDSEIKSEIGSHGNGIVVKNGLINIIAIALTAGVMWGIFRADVEANTTRSQANAVKLDNILRQLSEENAARRVMNAQLQALIDELRRRQQVH